MFEVLHLKSIILRKYFLKQYNPLQPSQTQILTRNPPDIQIWSMAVRGLKHGPNMSLILQRNVCNKILNRNKVSNLLLCLSDLSLSSSPLSHSSVSVYGVKAASPTTIISPWTLQYSTVKYYTVQNITVQYLVTLQRENGPAAGDRLVVGGDHHGEGGEDDHQCVRHLSSTHF